MNDEERLEASTLPAARNDLVERIAASRAKLEALIDGLDASALTRAGDEGWAPKDHLAHIARWERMLVAHLVDESDHEVVAMTPAEYARASLDELNARIHALTREWSADAVLGEFRDSHAALMAHVETMSDDLFTRTYWRDDPQWRTVMEKMAGDTYLHYEEHRGWISEITD